LRNHVRRRLREQAGDTLPDFLNLAGKRLEQWHRKSLVELREAFAAGAGIYRAQSVPLSSDEMGGPKVQADFQILRGWPK
jgi:hypothetical protein